MATDVSIIIPTYNYARFLPRAVESALAQTLAAREVIVVDDGSTDDTPAVAAQFGGRIRYLRQPNAGVSAARNAGGDLSQGEWLVFFDADDELLPDALATFAERLATQPAARMVVSGHHSLDREGRLASTSVPPELADCRTNFRQFLSRRWGIGHGSLALHREVWQRLHYPAGISNGEDLVFFAQALALFPAVSTPRPTVRVFEHGVRARDNLTGLAATGLSTVDRLFDSRILPPQLMGYEREFRVQRLLSLGRSFLRGGRHHDAWQMYCQACRLQPTAWCSPTQAGRMLRAAWGAMRSRRPAAHGS